ncbi:MAG TPA: phosphoadenosine phosphosulfate reductase family protein [Candidatus Paceibacterota bacterium]|nr:phosphoadenosine phosphosulfate reductase family protein [Candidatus Paceibacterota bacterium]
MQIWTEEAIDAYNTELACCSPRERIAWVLDRYKKRVLINCGIGVGSVVLMKLIADAAANIKVVPDIVTIDTGIRLAGTRRLIKSLRHKFRLPIQALRPSAEDLATVRHLPNLAIFTGPQGLEERLRCCNVRKEAPLRRKLKQYDAWMNSLVPDGATTDRTTVPFVQIDEKHGGILKFNPLADHTKQDFWDFIRSHRLPYHPAFDLGFGSVGCGGCCTSSGEDRNGRWPWEKNRSGATCFINDVQKKPMDTDSA